HAAEGGVLRRHRCHTWVALIHDVDVVPVRRKVARDREDALDVAVPHVIETERKDDEDRWPGSAHMHMSAHRPRRPAGRPAACPRPTKNGVKTIIGTVPP